MVVFDDCVCDIDPGVTNPAVEIEISGRPNMARIVD